MTWASTYLCSAREWLTQRALHARHALLHAFATATAWLGAIWPRVLRAGLALLMLVMSLTASVAHAQTQGVMFKNTPACQGIVAAGYETAKLHLIGNHAPDPTSIQQGTTCWLEIMAVSIPSTGIGFLDAVLGQVLQWVKNLFCQKLQAYWAQLWSSLQTGIVPLIGGMGPQGPPTLVPGANGLMCTLFADETFLPVGGTTTVRVFCNGQVNGYTWQICYKGSSDPAQQGCTNPGPVGSSIEVTSPTAVIETFSVTVTGPSGTSTPTPVDVQWGTPPGGGGGGGPGCPGDTEPDDLIEYYPGLTQILNPPGCSGGDCAYTGGFLIKSPKTPISCGGMPFVIVDQFTPWGMSYWGNPPESQKNTPLDTIPWVNAFGGAAYARWIRQQGVAVVFRFRAGDHNTYVHFDSGYTNLFGDVPEVEGTLARLPCDFANNLGAGQRGGNFDVKQNAVDGMPLSAPQLRPGKVYYFTLVDNKPGYASDDGQIDALDRFSTTFRVGPLDPPPPDNPACAPGGGAPPGGGPGGLCNCTVTASTLTPGPSDGVTFTAACSPAATSFAWELCYLAADGTTGCAPVPGTAQSQSFFTSAWALGSTVWAKVAGINAAGTGTVALSPKVSWQPVTPVCTVTATPMQPKAGEQNSYVATCTNNPTSYSWELCMFDPSGKSTCFPPFAATTSNEYGSSAMSSGWSVQFSVTASNAYGAGPKATGPRLTYP